MYARVEYSYKVLYFKAFINVESNVMFKKNSKYILICFLLYNTLLFVSDRELEYNSHINDIMFKRWSTSSLLLVH